MTEQMSPSQTGQIPGPALWLGLSGLIPFAGLAVAPLWLGAEGALQAQAALLVYGAVILSFMGGCRWGFAAAGLGGGPGWAPLGVSVLPALFGWAAVLLFAGPQACVALAAGFAALFLADAALTRTGGAPPWWTALRFPLSLGAAGSLMVSALLS